HRHLLAAPYRCLLRSCRHQPGVAGDTGLTSDMNSFKVRPRLQPTPLLHCDAASWTHTRKSLTTMATTAQPNKDSSEKAYSAFVAPMPPARLICSRSVLYYRVSAGCLTRAR